MIRFALIIAVLALAACGSSEVRPQPQPGPGPEFTAALGHLGAVLTWVGGISAAAGIALRVVAFFYPPLAAVAGIFGFLAIGGASITATGVSAQWLADNPWLLLLATAASCGAVVWWYWPGIRRALDRRLAGKG
jgi:hypothetical protein